MELIKININGFHHIAIDAKDYDKTYNFYSEVLGFKEKLSWKMNEGKRAVMLDSGKGNYLEIFEGRDYEIKEGAYKHLAFLTDNCEEIIEEVRKAGAEITQEPEEFDIPSEPVKKVKIAFCKGPDGEVIEFFEER